jgi:hypothetical protein
MIMKSDTLEKFVSELPGYHFLNEKQQENVSKLQEISKKFLQKAGVSPDAADSVSSSTIVLESGHQPNFLPHSGTWKKAFLLQRCQNQLKAEGKDAVAFFGFADRNISTARVLSKNQIPAMNREGSIKIGFNINNKDKFKTFCSVDKPTRENWEKEISRILLHYSDNAKKNRSEELFFREQWEYIYDHLWKSYERADNFAELNSIIFSRLCSDLFGIKPHFFLYSDMYRHTLFIDESQKILRNLSQFNQSYNRAILEKKLDIPHVSARHLPFWYNCDCGMKVDIEADVSFMSVIQCPACKKEYDLTFSDDFNNLSRYYKNMDFTAVSRNIAMAEGLGDTLFLTGVGGSLQYGKISDQISHDLGFHSPLSLAWRSRDYYLGRIHRAAMYELMKQFSLVTGDLLTPALHQKIAHTFHQLSLAIQEAESANNQKDRKHWSGMEGHAKNMAVFAKKIFSVTPSFLDILANQETKSIIAGWTGAFSVAEVKGEQNFYLMNKDITYPPHLLSDIPPDDLAVLYKNIRNIEVE